MRNHLCEICKHAKTARHLSGASQRYYYSCSKRRIVVYKAHVEWFGERSQPAGSSFSDTIAMVRACSHYTYSAHPVIIRELLGDNQ